jgi:hypothetical protein
MLQLAQFFDGGDGGEHAVEHIGVDRGAQVVSQQLNRQLPPKSEMTELTSDKPAIQ